MMTKEESIATHNKQGLPPYKDLERNCVSNALPFADENYLSTTDFFQISLSLIIIDTTSSYAA